MNDPKPTTETPNLPEDPDLGVDQGSEGHARPVHLRLPYLGLVFVGGTLGTATREALSLALPPVNGIPYAIFGVNIVGAFLLGLLLEALSHRGPDHGHRRTLRLLLGTGFMGGFTTYSALAADSAVLIGHGASGTGIAYALATVLVGAIASWGGIAVGAATHRPAREVA